MSTLKCCPRCHRAIKDVRELFPVEIIKGEVVHVCAVCKEEARQIDKEYTLACAKAKRDWLDNIDNNEKEKTRHERKQCAQSTRN